MAAAWLEGLRDRLTSADVVIRWRSSPARAGGRGRVLIRGGGLPRSRHEAIRSFFEQDLGLEDDLRVRVWLGKKGGGAGSRVSLDVAGRLDAGRRQRLRNFLIAELE